MNNKRKEFIKIIMISVFIVSLLLSVIVSLDSHDINHCQDEHCFKCLIIHAAQYVIQEIATIFVYLVMYFIIQLIFSKMHILKKNYMHDSLVFQKVQMNN